MKATTKNEIQNVVLTIIQTSLIAGISYWARGQVDGLVLFFAASYFYERHCHYDLKREYRLYKDKILESK